MAMRRCVGEALLERDYFNPIAFTRISYEECHYLECIHYVECIAFDLLYKPYQTLVLQEEVLINQPLQCNGQGKITTSPPTETL